MHLQRVCRSASALIVCACLAVILAVPACNTPARRDRPAARAARDAGSSNGWTIGVGSGVAVLTLLGSLLFLNTRKGPARPRAPRPVSPPLPPDVPEAPPVDATAICIKPSAMPAARAPADAIRSGLPRPPLPALLSEPEISTDIRLPAGPDSRGPTLACGSCGRVVPADRGVPPWCPHCGSDLKPASSRTTASTVESGALVPSSLLQPPYFIARTSRSYRVYVLPKQLLFIDCPIAEDRTATERAVMGVSIQGGLVGAMIGSAIAGAMQRDRLAATRDRNWMLNMADERELIAIAETEYPSFALDFEDLRDVVIEALTFWQHTFGDRCAARLRLLHPVRGPMTFDLPRSLDVGVAIKQLTPRLGERITVNATWDWGKNRYVQKA